MISVGYPGCVADEAVEDVEDALSLADGQRRAHLAGNGKDDQVGAFLVVALGA